MVQKSRIAPESDARAVSKRGRKPPVRPGRTAFRNIVSLVFLASLLYGLPALFGPYVFHDLAHGAMRSAAAFGEWVRVVSWMLFRSIPVF